MLIDSSISYEEYWKNLSTSSKRFLNLGNRKFCDTITTNITTEILKQDLKYILPTEQSMLIRLLLDNKKKHEQPEHYFVKYYNVDMQMVSYNHVSITYSTIKAGYCNCFVIFDKNFVGNKLFNIFSWFKFIELIFNYKLLDIMDLVVDSSLYKYNKLLNNVAYNCCELETSSTYLAKRNKTTGGFGDENSSKFLFLTKADKTSNKNLISVLCTCGHKTLLEIYNEKNVCFCCNNELSRLL